MGERAVQLVILCCLFLFMFRLRRGNWHVTSRMRIDRQVSQISLLFLFIFVYLFFLILLVRGIPETSQESIGFVEESLTL